jgi:multidrug efflux system membrane fusion protein
MHGMHVAPIAGRVGSRQVDPGNIVHASDATASSSSRSCNRSRCSITLPRDQRSAGHERLASGDVLSGRSWDRDNKNRSHRQASNVDNQIDTRRAPSKLKAEFPNRTARSSRTSS